MRNVILITLDSLRADHCSFMGYYRKNTPTIDSMAKNGLYFKNCVVASLPTPTSMYSVFTGEYFLGFEGVKNILHSELKVQFSIRKTIAEVLSKKGYETLAFNSNPYIPGTNGFGKGFINFNFLSEDLGKRQKLLSYILRGMRVNRDIRDTVLGSGISANWEKYYDSLVKQIGDSKEPYFAWIILLDTHIPYLPPKRKFSKFYENLLINLEMRRIKWRGNLDIEKRDKLINAYDDSIHHADAFVDRLWRDTRDEDPIFILHSDHGDGFGEHGFYHHPPMLYEELIHVPLVIYNADLKGKIEKPVSLLGLSPTILELIGKENQFSSESFLEGYNDWVISQVFERGKRKIAVRMKDWKFIKGQKEEDELYNLEKDPQEQANLINEYPKLVKAMNKIVRLHICAHE